MKPAITLFICSIALLTSCRTGTKDTAATSNIPRLPSNWQPVDSANAVILGMNSYTRGEKTDTDFVVIVNLAAGGGIRILDSVYTTDTCSPVFNSYSVTDPSGRGSFWSLFKDSSSFAMANLEFFNFNGSQIDTAEVCYPVYKNGNYISQGCTTGTCNTDQTLPKRILIVSDTISIQDYPATVPCTNFPIPAATLAAVVGNHPLANRDSNQHVARTYIGKQGTNLILYTSPHAKDADIYAVLQQEFNVAATNIIMFDGGGSTQMICNGRTYIPSSDTYDRWVPSAIEIHSAGAVQTAAKK